MGRPMAANLAKQGFEVRSCDLKGHGSCKSIREAAEGADALITMLPDGEAVREAVLEALPALPAGAVVIDMSSADPASTRALAPALRSKGIEILDAPVSGAVAKAKEGTLAIMVGGNREVFEKSTPVLRAVGKDLFHVGSLGAGHAVKALNSYLGASGMLAGFEALLIARAFGLEPLVLQAIGGKIPEQVLTGADASGFKLALMAKDIGIAAGLARDLGVEAPYLKETLRLWRAAQKRLRPQADHTEMLRFLERLKTPSRAAPAPRSNLRRKRRRST